MKKQTLKDISGEYFILGHHHVGMRESQTGMWSLLGILALLIMTLVFSDNAQAGVYRCKDANGRIAYSQLPCPAEQQSDQLRGINSTVRQDKDLCRDARELAMHAFAELRTGNDPADLFDEYGGLNYINPPTLAVINFAASLRYNPDVSPQRVGAMAFARCREGGFGKLTAGDIPAFDVNGDIQKPVAESSSPVAPDQP